jgi:hypothetical protein
MPSAPSAVSILSLLSLLTLATACDTEAPADGSGLRALSYDVDISLALADGGEEDGTILWEIVEADVFDGPAIFGELRLYLDDGALFTADGVHTCQIAGAQLYASTGATAPGPSLRLTLWDNLVFAGSIDTSLTTRKRMLAAHGSQLLVEIAGGEVYLGQQADGALLVEASAELELASATRKLLVAALITGECGSPGIPGSPSPS